MRQINDDLSREYGLPVLLNIENNHGKNYAEIIAEEETYWKNLQAKMDELVFKKGNIWSCSAG